jgi:hypothetical protein
MRVPVDGRTAVQVTALHGDWDALSFLLGLKADINARNFGMYSC